VRYVTLHHHHQRTTSTTAHRIFQAQELRVESVALTAQAKNRSDLVIALSMQGKNATEIAEFLRLTGY
jgi:hypothetical protein